MHLQRLGFLGTGAANTVDLTPIRTGMEPFVHGLLNPPEPFGDHVIRDALDKVIGAVGEDKWNNFKTQWNDFESRNNLTFITPNANLEGIQVSVPFRVANSNAFSIEVPVLAVGAGLDSSKPFASTKIIPQGASLSSPLDAASRNLAANSSKDMSLIVTLRWRDLGNSVNLMALLGLDNSWSKSIDFTGETIFDLGYGPTRIKVNVPVTLKKQ